MEHPSSQYLFVYGTLRSDQPEHRFYGPESLSRTIARVAGKLYQLAEGYPILSVPSKSILLTAGKDWLGDWSEAKSAISAIPASNGPTGSPLVEGELLEIPLELDALSKPDQWEGFDIDRPSVYQRAIIPAIRENGTIVPAWAYVSTQIPSSAEPISKGIWERPEKLK